MLGGGYGGLLGLHRRLALGHPRAGRSGQWRGSTRLKIVVYLGLCRRLVSLGFFLDEAMNREARFQVDLRWVAAHLSPDPAL